MSTILDRESRNEHLAYACECKTLHLTQQSPVFHSIIWAIWCYNLHNPNLFKLNFVPNFFWFFRSCVTFALHWLPTFFKLWLKAYTLLNGHFKIGILVHLCTDFSFINTVAFYGFTSIQLTHPYFTVRLVTLLYFN